MRFYTVDLMGGIRFEVRNHSGADSGGLACLAGILKGQVVFAAVHPPASAKVI
jgi:hypothetical protein